MKTYQFTLAGYSGDTDETDHLIKWVVASALEIALTHAKEQGWVLQAAPEVILGGRAVTLEEGADAILN